MAKVIITKELQEHLKSNPKIKEVHFDAEGRHYFNVFKLIIGKKEGINEELSEETALFGKGVFSHRRVIPGDWNVDNMKEDIAKGDPSTLIVKTMKAEDVISYEVFESPDALIAQISNMDESSKLKLMSQLFPASVIEKLGLTGASNTIKPAEAEDEE